MPSTIKIKTVIYNKRFSSESVGLNGVVLIRYNALSHPGEKESMNIIKKNGTMNTIYDIDEVIYEPDTDQ